jgi:DNA-binding FadR family transcriptional regulator
MPRDTTKPKKGRVEKRLLSDAVVAGVRAYITDHKLKPGDRLPTEQELADRFGVSRISVREATKALRYLGVINSAPRRGLTVGTLDTKRLAEFLGFHAVLGAFSARDLVRARELVEVGSLPYVMQEMVREPGLYRRLLAIVEQPGLVTDPKRYLLADLEFHRSLLAASGLAPLIFFDELLRAFFERYSEEVAPGPEERENGLRFHRRILAALRDGQLGIAQDLVRESFESYRDLA